MKHLSSFKLVIATALTVFTITQNDIAASTMVTDATGINKELWTFEETLGMQKLVRKENQVDNKSIVQAWDANSNPCYWS
jgi:hypothetical protein